MFFSDLLLLAAFVIACLTWFARVPVNTCQCVCLCACTSGKPLLP